jgi:hypothetical protein
MGESKGINQGDCKESKAEVWCQAAANVAEGVPPTFAMRAAARLLPGCQVAARRHR